MQRVKSIIRENILRALLFIIIFLIILYIFSDGFRCYLVKENIDPNFIVGFSTTVALVLTLIQSSYDKKFNYNLRLVESIESKGLAIIGKLLVIKEKSSMLLITLKKYRDSIKNRQIYIDFNDISSQKDINTGLELIVAYIQTYFPSECSEWNEMLENLNIIGTYTNSVAINYDKNIDLIKQGQNFKNESLGKIDAYIIESEGINTKIDNLALKMTEKIVLKINNSTERLKDNFYFKF